MTVTHVHKSFSYQTHVHKTIDDAYKKCFFCPRTLCLRTLRFFQGETSEGRKIYFHRFCIVKALLNFKYADKVDQLSIDQTMEGVFKRSQELGLYKFIKDELFRLPMSETLQKKSLCYFPQNLTNAEKDQFLLLFSKNAAYVLMNHLLTKNVFSNEIKIQALFQVITNIGRDQVGVFRVVEQLIDEASVEELEKARLESLQNQHFQLANFIETKRQEHFPEIVPPFVEERTQMDTVFDDGYMQEHQDATADLFYELSNGVQNLTPPNNPSAFAFQQPNPLEMPSFLGNEDTF